MSNNGNRKILLLALIEGVHRQYHTVLSNDIQSCYFDMDDFGDGKEVILKAGKKRAGVVEIQ
jgi:hypothetical protein